ncbi:trypco2 family protein [Streptomyces davaonensis]|uniref:trypco2 family protein n=1 Tax=Streptomyces davaonensis TaxID=348043 RepID=UPI001E61FED8|nr:trypco2 family protein [Streptomyces davaonensis]
MTIGLAAAIEELRRELYEAQDQGAHQQFAFEIEEAELELMLELRDDVKGDGKLQFGVVTVGGERAHSSVRGHKLTLRLQVKDRATGGAIPLISSDRSGSWDSKD